MHRRRITTGPIRPLPCKRTMFRGEARINGARYRDTVWIFITPKWMVVSAMAVYSLAHLWP